MVMFTSPAFANGSAAPCVVSYGGYQNCPTGGNLVINKTVAHPTSGQYVDNLSVSDPKYAPDSMISFQITVTNTGGSELTNVLVKDMFPTELTFNSGAGSYDKNDRMLSFTIDSLKPSESKTYTVTVKAMPIASMTSDVMCPTNKVSAAANGQSSEDTSSVCLQKNGGITIQTKGGLPVYSAPKVTSTPATGPESLPLIGIAISAAVGYISRRKALRG